MNAYITEGTPLNVLLLGLVTGVAFGFVIFKSGASRYDKILKMLLLRDMRILKFMMMTVMAASVIIFLTGSVIYIAPTQLIRLIVGGALFGVGFGMLGYCPGTGMVALGEGKKDAGYGILGALLGAGLFAHFYPVLEPLFITPYNLGRLTIHSIFGVSYGTGVIILLIVFTALLLVVDKMARPTVQPITKKQKAV